MKSILWTTCINLRQLVKDGNSCLYEHHAIIKIAYMSMSQTYRSLSLLSSFQTDKHRVERTYIKCTNRKNKTKPFLKNTVSAFPLVSYLPMYVKPVNGDIFPLCTLIWHYFSAMGNVNIFNQSRNRHVDIRSNVRSCDRRHGSGWRRQHGIGFREPSGHLFLILMDLKIEE